MIILGLSVEQKYIPEIIEAFEITDNPRIKVDNSGSFKSEEDRQKDRKKKRERVKKSRRIDTL